MLSEKNNNIIYATLGGIIGFVIGYYFSFKKLKSLNNQCHNNYYEVEKKIIDGKKEIHNEKEYCQNMGSNQKIIMTNNEEKKILEIEDVGNSNNLFLKEAYKKENNTNYKKITKKYQIKKEYIIIEKQENDDNDQYGTKKNDNEDNQKPKNIDEIKRKEYSFSSMQYNALWQDKDEYVYLKQGITGLRGYL